MPVPTAPPPRKLPPTVVEVPSTSLRVGDKLFTGRSKVGSLKFVTVRSVDFLHRKSCNGVHVEAAITYGRTLCYDRVASVEIVQ